MQLIVNSTQANVLRNLLSVDTYADTVDGQRLLAALVKLTARRQEKAAAKAAKAAGGEKRTRLPRGPKANEYRGPALPHYGYATHKELQAQLRKDAKGETCTETRVPLEGSALFFLELDKRTMTYTREMNVPAEFSQGWFAFSKNEFRRARRAHRRATAALAAAPAVESNGPAKVQQAQPRAPGQKLVPPMLGEKVVATAKALREAAASNTKAANAVAKVKRRVAVQNKGAAQAQARTR